MRYLNDRDIEKLGISWHNVVAEMERAVRCMERDDYVQPIKPYLRYRNPKNRIIAMPAYVGEPFHTAGIKWIASFPDNLSRGLPRAHSIVILNDADTGVPKAVIRSNMLSVIRTAAISGLLIHYERMQRPKDRLAVGIIGWGPIGRAHFDMCMSLIGDSVERVFLYDQRGIKRSMIPAAFADKTAIVNSWQEAYTDSDYVITCTAADTRYINLPPKAGATLLDVSLRDYTVEALQPFPFIVVDSWDEVCRENTDISLLAANAGLTRQETCSIIEIVCSNAFSQIEMDTPVLFCPMGMAVFDICCANYYLNLAIQYREGMEL